MKTKNNKTNSANLDENMVQKNSLVMLVMITIFLSLFSGTAKSSNIYEPVYDSLTVLEMEGRILNPVSSYTVELISNDGHVDTLVVKNKSKFKFVLSKDQYYVIRLSMKGHVTKMVGVNTEILGETDGLYRFMFETMMLKEEALVHLNKDVADMPIAIVYFDYDSNNFVYSKKYTDNLKKEMRRGKSVNNNNSTISSSSKVLAKAYSN